jgi:hypothetical protein
MNDVNLEREESQKTAGQHMEAIFWGGVILWAGLVFGADSLGYLPQIGGAEVWSWLFLGAGVYALLLDLWRMTSPDYANPTMGDYVAAGILLLLGLGGFFDFNLSWPLILVLIGLAILGKALLRRR